MHQALYVDEILREIFEILASGSRSTLAYVSRCCKAWEDPALDVLWLRLPDVCPLLLLIPGVIYRKGKCTISGVPSVEDLKVFYSYASRVQHISHRSSLAIEQVLLQVLTAASRSRHLECLLPNLRCIRVGPACSVGLVQVIGASKCLRTLHLDVGFGSHRQHAHMDALVAFLKHAAGAASELEEVYLRGLVPLRALNAVVCTPTLRALSLRTGSCLSACTLSTIVTLPNLTSLEVHAADVDADEVTCALSSNKDACFPVLQQLNLRADAPLIKLLIGLLRADTLDALRMELQSPSTSSSPQTHLDWSPIISLIRIRAASTLRELTLEHHAPPVEEDNTHPHPPQSQVPPSVRSELILPALPQLRRLVVDISAPSSMGDAELGRLAANCPMLEHLDLGTGTEGAPPRLTSASLLLAAKHLPHLASLVLPVRLDGALGEPAEHIQHVLACLTLAGAPSADVEPAAIFLAKTFPSLKQVDGPEEVEQWEKLWKLCEAKRCVT